MLSFLPDFYAKIPLSLNGSAFGLEPESAVRDQALGPGCWGLSLGSVYF